MTITEYEPTVDSTVDDVGDAMAPAVYERLPKNILADGISSGDHKVIGRIWILAAMAFGLFTLVADILVRIERIDTGGVALFSNRFAFEQWFTLGRVSLVFLFVVPLLIGIATTVVPLQLGAPSVAFPRASAAALWTWMIAGIMMIVSWAIDGGLIDRDVTDVNGPTMLSMVSMAAVVLALLVAAMVVVTTIFTERPEGMSLYNVPLFSWSMLVAGGIWLLSFPVLIANLIVMWVDARGDAFHSFGGDGLWQQVSWAFDQPQVFAYAIPVLGMIGEVVPVALRRRLKQYDMAMIAIGAFGAFSFGAWAQTFFNPTANTTWLYVVGSVSLLLPLLAMIGSLALTAVAAGRAPTFSSHLALAGMALVSLLAAGALAALRVADSLLAPVIGFIHDVIDFIGPDWDWIDDLADWFRDSFDEVASSSMSGAMVQLTLVSGLLAALAGLFFWAPKIIGRRLPPSAGVLAGLSLLGGALLTAVPDAISGLMDQPDFTATVSQGSGVEFLNLLSLIGSIGVFAGFGMVFAALAAAFLLPARDDDDEDLDERNPWGGHTLEWLSESPPAPGNFAGPYVVTSEAPLLDDDFENPYAGAES